MQVTQIVIMPSPLDFYTLFAIGFVIITLEVFIYSFVVVWFGIGFLIVALSSLFFPIDSLIWQLAMVSVISLLFLVLFRKKLLAKFSKPERQMSDNFFDEKGFGEIKNGKVFFKGTYWEFDSNIDETEFEDGEKVIVLKIKDNQASIKKTQERYTRI